MAEGTANLTESSSQLKTLIQLRELVYVPLRDSERAFIEEWYVDAMLNEAYLDINARLRLNQDVDTGTTASDGTLALPADFVEVMDFWITDAQSNAIQPQFVDNAKYNSWARPGTSSPFRYIARVFAGSIETFPALESLDYRLEFVARPASMVNDTDTPDALDPEMQPRLVAYAIAKAKWQEGEPAEAGEYMAQYEQGLPGSPRMTFKVRPAPMTIIPEPGPFG